jgi:APA family basic amino acid/polyamine antiporter
VGSSIYYALGVVALVALGATPIALLLAGILFIFTALSYAEGTAMLPEAGGSASFARHGFNDFVGFLSGWALMLSYIVTIAISAYIICPYLGIFWEPLKTNPVIGTAVSMGTILFLMVINVIGVRESSRLNVFSTVLDLATQLSLIILGFFLIFELGTLVQNMFGEGNWPLTRAQLVGGIEGYWPSLDRLVFGVALAALAFTGVETVSQMAEETRHPQVRAPRALMLMTVTVLILFIGISIIALSAMPTQDLTAEWARDPVAGIAAHLPESLQTIYKPLVGVLAATILLIATNAGLLGISRLAFSMSTHQQIPSALGRVHHRFRTPYVSIILLCLVAILLLIPGFFTPSFFEDLGALYTFGALLSFAFAHASIMSLRVKQPDLSRPFKLGLNIKIKGYEIPSTALLGLIATAAIWVVIIIAQEYARWVGFGWMLLGLFAYYLYRRHKHLPLT